MNKEITKARRWLIIVITSLSAFMATLDGSIVNIALPVLSGELHVSVETASDLLSRETQTFTTEAETHKM